VKECFLKVGSVPLMVGGAMVPSRYTAQIPTVDPSAIGREVANASSIACRWRRRNAPGNKPRRRAGREITSHCRDLAQRTLFPNRIVNYDQSGFQMAVFHNIAAGPRRNEQ
jgi:hypothetical protein